MSKRFVPVYVDHFQASAYKHVATTVESDGSLVAHFGDGSTRPSIYTSLEEMLAAGEMDWREKMREVRWRSYHDLLDDARASAEMDRCRCCGSHERCECELTQRSGFEDILNDERGTITRSVTVDWCETHRCEVE